MLILSNRIVVLLLLSVMAGLSQSVLAARTISGTISYEMDGSPVNGARVQAWDSDLDWDDFMGEDYTDTNGRYEIRYEGGHWDPAPHAITVWRPDIYLKVFIPSNNQWIEVRKSEKYNNHPHRDNLSINLAIKGGAVVYGQITDQNGAPVEGLIITARDFDFVTNHDTMSSAITDVNGNYRIEYSRKHWDPAPHFTGLWRPDIFVEYMKSGYIIEPDQSSVFWDHPLREDLRIDQQVNIYPDLVTVSGNIVYEEADALPNLNNDPRGDKPIRLASVSLRLVGEDDVVRSNTDNEGHFEIVMQRHPGKTYKLVLRPYNFTARVFRDLDACNEQVWWRRKFTMNDEGDIDLGTLRVGITASQGLEGFWKEVEGNFIHDIFCGGSRHDMAGGSAYFNIAETLLVARAYANTNRDDSDSIGRVSVTYPDPTIHGMPYTNPFFGEIYLPRSHAGFGNIDFGFLDENIIHEYSHHLAEEISENDWALQEHDACTDTNTEQAWFEGFADYMASLLLNSHRTGDRFLTQTRGDYDIAESPYDECPDLNMDMEASVWATLWDLADEVGVDFPDSIVETHDTLTLEDGLVFQIFDRELDNLIDAPDICEFRDAWKARLTGTRDW
ncbi:MAG: carboxypeptidase-like regulatory domain-containing protein, partial [Gammaproteobacteria bacterium]|nr:carboxypeptidase-like regulatory domain-containing protein [Gammaproteobacteria bacterium]